MKFINKFLILFVIFAINAMLSKNVLAYECKYTGDPNHGQSWWNSTVGNDGYLRIEIDGNEIKPLSGDINDVIDPYIDSNWTYERIIQNLNGGCQSSVVLCQLNNNDFGTVGQFLIMNDTLEAKLLNMGTIQIPRKSAFGTMNVNYSYGNCVWFSLNDDESTGPSVTVTYECETYDNDYHKKFLDNKKEYDECVETESSSKCFAEHQKYLEAKDILTDYCNSIFDHLDQANSCMKRCLEFSDEIASLENKLDNTGNKCNLTARLVKYVRNILRWAKYIIPALVIILGMIDFIRAIGSNSDDEMKKAQQRFIKRLIAAVILFLLPLLIEFLLNAFRIDSTFCDFY